MASSNRHWPSMFKSKPSHHHHQWQPTDINSSLISTGCQRSPHPSSGGCEERSPEPKPRWNPRPEQIRILEAIFNSGMVNPPRDEIRKIRAQLQEYGQVGDANVFYWFQNRKSRSKHKQRHLQNKSQTSLNAPTTTTTTTAAARPITTHHPNSSSSSSSDKSSPNSTDKILSLGATNSPTASVNQTFFQSQNDFLSVPFFFPPPPALQQPTSGSGGSTSGAAPNYLSQGFSFPDVTDHNSVETCSGLLLSDLLLMNNHGSLKKAADDDKMKLNYSFTPTLSPTITSSISTIDTIPAGGETGGPTKSTVFINDVAFEVTMAPFNVRESFGDDAVLVHSSGQPVLTNEWGVTLEPLQHGTFYYLIRTLPPSPSPTTAHHNTTIHLIWYYLVN